MSAAGHGDGGYIALVVGGGKLYLPVNHGRGDGGRATIIKAGGITNLRCIKDVTIPCDPLTVLVGANGSGKSTVLRALELFYSPTARYAEEDFHGGRTEEPITITLTFSDLTEEELALFAPYLDRDTLTVEKILAWPLQKGSQRYYGSRLGNPDFQATRAATRMTERKMAFQGLVESGRYPDLRRLPARAPEEQIEETLREWEGRHPEALRRIRDDGQFFGFKEVGEAHLERYTHYLPIPAVRDAATDATEGRGSAITELMDLVVRKVLAEREDMRQFREDAQRRYRELMDPSRMHQLTGLADDMTRTIDTFAPGTEVKLDWVPGNDIDIPTPQAKVRVVEDGYPSAVERAGHGVQRAFILTALQHLAAARAPGVPPRQAGPESPGSSGSKPSPGLPNLILGIEEPELYQHPSRQRHLATVLLGLTGGGIKGVAQRTQVLYSTHSPLLVDLQRFNQIRLLRKEEPFPGMPKQTKLHFTTTAQVVADIERADGERAGAYDPDHLAVWLQTLMTPWTNEGFFAEVVVLVEGEEDRAAVLGVGQSLGHAFDRLNISVIPCGGKTNLHKAAAVFRSFDIPVYVVWDSDEGRKDRRPEDNHRLLRLHGEEREDYPARITNSYACFKENLGGTLREEIGPELYEGLLSDCVREFGFDDRDQAMKKPFVVQTIIKRALEKGKRSPSLETIVHKLLGLHRAMPSDRAPEG